MVDKAHLSSRAVKLASRIQRLPSGKAYSIVLVKDYDEWLFIVRRDSKDGLEIEKIK
jgi:hypothetical protein